MRKQFADVDQYFGDDPRNYADLTSLNIELVLMLSTMWRIIWTDPLLGKQVPKPITSLMRSVKVS